MYIINGAEATDPVERKKSYCRYWGTSFLARHLSPKAMSRVVVSVTQSLPFLTAVAVVQLALQLWLKELLKFPT